MQLFEILVVFLYKYSYYRKLPFREYALPLKRERWHAKRAGEGATCRGGFANARRDAHINVSVIKKAGIKCSLLKFLIVSRSAFYCGNCRGCHALPSMTDFILSWRRLIIFCRRDCRRLRCKVRYSLYRVP